MWRSVDDAKAGTMLLGGIQHVFQPRRLGLI
jgi:hypothetical protein